MPTLTKFDLEQEGSVKTIHDKKKRKQAVSFFVDEDDDSESLSSLRVLSSEYTTTNKETGKTPSPRQASTSVVTPKAGDVSSSAGSG